MSQLALHISCICGYIKIGTARTFTLGRHVVLQNELHKGQHSTWHDILLIVWSLLYLEAGKTFTKNYQIAQFILYWLVNNFSTTIKIIFNETKTCFNMERFRSLVYQISYLDCQSIYIGETSQKIVKRLKLHKH